MNIHDKIENMFPQHMSGDLENHQTLVEFVSEYYKFMDSGMVSYEIIPASGDEAYIKGDTIKGLISGATAKINSVTPDKIFVTPQPLFVDFEKFVVVGNPNKPTSTLLSYEPGATQVKNKLEEYRDVDKTPNNNVMDLFREFMAIIPYNLTEDVDKRKLLKEISSLYRVKGTEASIKILFKILSRSDASVYYPSIDILKASDGKLISEIGLRCKRSDILDKFSEENIGSIIGSKAIHTNSSGLVERVVKHSDDLYDIIFIKNSITGDFEINETDTRYPLLDQFIIITATDGKKYQFELLNVISNEDVKIDFTDPYWANDQLNSITDEVTISVPNNATVGDNYQVASAYKRSDNNVTDYQLLNEMGSAELSLEDGGSILQEEYSLDLIYPSNSLTWDYSSKSFTSLDGGNGWAISPELTTDENPSNSGIENAGAGNHLYRCQVNIPNAASGTYNIPAGDSVWGAPHLIGANATAEISAITSGHITRITSIGSGGSGYAIGDEISISSNEPPTEISPARALVTGISAGGSVNALSLLDKGAGFKKNPNVVTGGSGHGLSLDMLNDPPNLETHGIGCVSEIIITNPGQDYENGANPKITVNNSQYGIKFISNYFKDKANSGVKAGKLFRSNLTYINNDGFISEERKRIRDGYYYQEYSYVIKTSEPRSRWSNILKSSLHPVGLIFFSESLISLSGDVSVKPLANSVTPLNILTGSPLDYGLVHNDPVGYYYNYGDLNGETIYLDYQNLI